MPDNVGRPPIYETKEELQKRIDEYFRECEGIPFFDEDREREYDLKFDWSYSMIESRVEGWAQLKDAQAMGVKSKAEVCMAQSE